MNRTLMEKTRNMFNGVILEKNLWVESVATTCYLINNPPTLSLVDKTPMEVSIGKNISL
jgi:hypothetical protein